MIIEKTIVRELRRLMGLIGLVILMGLISCSSDDYEEQPQASQGTIIPEVASYVTWFEEFQQSHRTNRVWEAPTGYVTYEGGKQPIGIAFTQNTKEPMMGSFFFSSGKWRTSVEDIKAETYYLYGYIPHLPAIRYSITDLDGTNANYSTGAIMTLENVPTVMANDLCVAIGAKQGEDEETVEGLRRGDFAYAAKATSGGGEDAKGNYVFLLFDHLYASMRVKMKVYPDYAALRTIKLKSLKLSTQAGETTSKAHNTITIKLEANDGSTDPIQEITYTPTGEEIGVVDEDGIEFWKSETSVGETLTTDFKTFDGYFMSSGITTLDLTSIYDVYDTKDNLIREDCKVTNTVVISELWPGQTVTRRSNRYTVKMIIQPTFLYVLSDPDLDNPTVSVE